jgi:hypothetical protein
MTWGFSPILKTADSNFHCLLISVGSNPIYQVALNNFIAAAQKEYDN